MEKSDNASVLDTTLHPTAIPFINLCAEFLSTIADLTPGPKLQTYLNTHHGPGTKYYDALCSHIKSGLEAGWVAETPIAGPNYRRGKIALPSEATRYFSITTVYMNSVEEFRGQYHSHPYGEINCVVQLDDTAELMGMSGWQGAGWTSPGPGSHHYPEVRGGALVALFFLPAGRVSYEATPDMEQPVGV